MCKFLKITVLLGLMTLSARQLQADSMSYLDGTWNCVGSTGLHIKYVYSHHGQQLASQVFEESDPETFHSTCSFFNQSSGSKVNWVDTFQVCKLPNTSRVTLNGLKVRGDNEFAVQPSTYPNTPTPLICKRAK